MACFGFEQKVSSNEQLCENFVSIIFVSIKWDLIVYGSGGIWACVAIDPFIEYLMSA